MNVYALVPLIAAIAYIPLFVILLSNRPWQRRHRLFLLFLIPAVLWSLSTFLSRSGLLLHNSPLEVKIVLCIAIWMLIQLHYFVSSFYQPGRIKIPLAYIFLISAIALAAMGYIPRSIEVTASSINVDYGPSCIALFSIFLFTLGTKDIYSLIQRYRLSPDPAERNQIFYLLTAVAVLTVFLFSSISPRGVEFPVPHVGNLVVACVFTPLLPTVCWISGLYSAGPLSMQLSTVVGLA